MAERIEFAFGRKPPTRVLNDDDVAMRGELRRHAGLAGAIVGSALHQHRKLAGVVGPEHVGAQRDAIAHLVTNAALNDDAIRLGKQGDREEEEDGAHTKQS